MEIESKGKKRLANTPRMYTEQNEILVCIRLIEIEYNSHIFLTCFKINLFLSVFKLN